MKYNSPLTLCKNSFSLKTMLFALMLVLATNAFAQTPSTGIAFDLSNSGILQSDFSTVATSTTLNTGDQFIYRMNYSLSSYVDDGINVAATINLPANVVLDGTLTNGSAISYATSDVTGATQTGNTITVHFKSPLPAGTTGALDLRLKLAGGTTPDGYSTNFFTTFTADNNTNLDGTHNNGTSTTTITVTGTSSNKYTISKAKKYGGGLDNFTIYQIDINNNNGTSGGLNLTNPTVTDVLPAGVDMASVTATPFNNSDAPIIDIPTRTITWRWTAHPEAFDLNYSSNAKIQLKYTSSTFSVGNEVCNQVALTGTNSTLTGPVASTKTSNNECFNLTTATTNVDCQGTEAFMTNIDWLKNHLLPGMTDAVTIPVGWINSGKTQLDNITLTNIVDPKIDVTKIHLNEVKDGFDEIVNASILVEYELHSALGTFVTLGNYSSVGLADGSVAKNQNLPTIANSPAGSGDWITKIKYTITPASGTQIPLAAYQSLSYLGTVRTESQKAKDGSGITYKATSSYNPATVGTSSNATTIENKTDGSFSYNGTSSTFSSCDGFSDILEPSPVFHPAEKSYTDDSKGNYSGGDTINYKFHTDLRGNKDATDVTVTDVLDPRVSYIDGSSTFTKNGVNTPFTLDAPTIDASGNTTLTYHLGNLAVSDNYDINFSVRVKPGTPAGTINNQFVHNSGNALFAQNDNSNVVPVQVISNVSLRAKKGQSSCGDPNTFYYHPSVASAQEAGKIYYKINVVNEGNVAAEKLRIYDVFPFRGDPRGSQWEAVLVDPITCSDNNVVISYTTVSNPCFDELTPQYKNPGCKTPSWSTTPPANITQVKAIKIERNSSLPILGSFELTWPMRAPVGVPNNVPMNNSITYQVDRADVHTHLNVATPNRVSMLADCAPLDKGSIGNYVWIDANKDGISTNEPANKGLNGVKVELWSPGDDEIAGNGDDNKLDSSYTSNDYNGNPGYYKFINLDNGKYYVKFPTTFDVTPVTASSFGTLKLTTANQTNQTDFNSDADEHTGLSELVTIDVAKGGQDKDNTTIDAGYFTTGSIGNYVWYDRNGDGLQNEAATDGVNGVQVDLLKETTPGTYVKVGTTTTADDGSGKLGYYNFVIDANGNYKVQFQVVAPYTTFTTKDITTAKDGNSDADASGLSPVIAMDIYKGGVSQNNPTIDAGYCSGNPTVPPIAYSGSTSICEGGHNYKKELSNSFAIKGTWSSDNVSIASVDANGEVTGHAHGTATISYTVTNACGTTIVTVPITVNSNPAAPTLTITQASCSVSDAKITINGAPSAGMSYSKDDGDYSNTTGSFTVPGVASAFNITTKNSNNCTSDVTVADVTVQPSTPTAFSVTGTGLYCANTTGRNVGLSNSQSGVKYQLMSGGSPVGATVNGTGSSISFGKHTAGTYTIEATGNVGGCTKTMNGSAVITLTPLPSVFNVAGGGLYCINGSGLAITLSGSEVGVDYQLQKGGVNQGSVKAGTGSALTFANITPAGTYTIIAKAHALNSCNVVMAGTATITIISPIAYNVTGGGAYCAGGSGVLVGLSSSETNVVYQLYRGATAIGSPIAETGSALDFGLQTVAGTYTIVATSTLLVNPCQTNMTGNAVVVINPNPTLSGAALTAPTCSGLGATIQLTGLLPNTTSTINYAIDNVAQIPVTGVVSNGAGVATFVTRPLNDVTDGYKNLEVTGVTTTSAAPSCGKTFQYYLTLLVYPQGVATSISYTSPTFCAVYNNVAHATLVGSSGGVYTASPAGLSLNSSNGDIYLGSSAPGTYTITYAVGHAPCNASATTTVTINAALSASISYSGGPYCLTGSVTTASVTRTGTAGGTYSASPAGLVINAATGDIDIPASSPGGYTVTYNFNGGGCSNSVQTWFGIYSCTVSSGSSGGTESKSLGDVITKRTVTAALNGTNGAIDYSVLPLMKTNTSKLAVMGVADIASTNLSTLMPSLDGFVGRTTSPTDLTGFTNAVEVQSIDYTKNNLAKAVAFATKTTGELYSHTKPICDRLKGSTLLSIDTFGINGFSLVRFALQNKDGNVEYASSFSIGTAANRSSFSVQSNWLMKDYVGDDVMYNFQLWAVSPKLVVDLAQNIFNKISGIASATLLSSSKIPPTYVVSGSREADTLKLAVNNATTFTEGYFELKVKSNESATSTATQRVPFTVAANGKTSVAIPMSDSYESDVTMYVNGKIQDVVYMSDGAWAVTGKEASTSLQSFTVSNDVNRVYNKANEFAVFRNIALKATSAGYVTVSKILKGGALTVDLSTYKSLKFEASGGYNLRIALVNEAEKDWSKQYSYYMPLANETSSYTLSLSDFANAAGTKLKDVNLTNINAIVMSVEVGTGVSSQIATTISNINFSKEDPAYLVRLASKEVSIFPNPSKGAFNCSFNSQVNSKLTLRVIELTSGREVYSQQISAVKGNNTVPVNITNKIGGGTGMFVISIGNANAQYNKKAILIKPTN